ncbi:hypothetical protein CAEBREN_09519 [Caenorhabditis brenneri]|uniref:Uncharacterized protein n=1 Tax=Caenorhabditis brenneri TaxID=135651 RepID=G0N2Y5_CAEBE|nr:hypothetical protein CAEBREN_09519 [Caenorhabditis brenneri]
MKNTNERDNAYMEYIIKMSHTATFPCGRGKLLKDFGKATGNAFHERLYEKSAYLNQDTQPHQYDVQQFLSSLGQPNHSGSDFDPEIQEQKPFDFLNQAPPPGPSEVVFSRDIKQDPSEVIPSGRISTAPSISSLQNFHQLENHYANFLKGVHFFLQDYTKNPLELKKMAREAKENHLGMKITPKTLISYLDVCLGDVICLDSVQHHPEGVVNLKEFLEELKKCAEDFGDVLQTKIVIIVDGININVRDDDKVPLAGVMESFSQMVRRLKARVEKLEQRGV